MKETAWPSQSRRKGFDSRSGVTSTAARRTQPRRPGRSGGTVSGAASARSSSSLIGGGGYLPLPDVSRGQSPRHGLKEALASGGARRGLEEPLRAAAEVAEVD